jgi:uncharacterized protein (DUF1800 family)
MNAAFTNQPREHPLPPRSRGFPWLASGAIAAAALLLLACTAPAGPGAPGQVASSTTGPFDPVDAYRRQNRLTWGATPSFQQLLLAGNPLASLEGQLHPAAARVPEPVQTQIDAMTIVQRPLEALVQAMEQRRKDAEAIAGDEEKKAAQQAYQQEMNRLAREAASRHVLRALYSADQVQEQMVWFWLNHFSVHQNKSNLRAMVGDYEESAIRPRALGKFRDLLGAVARHPAMLRYLDNEQNAAGRINENYARELMELHTLGVAGGYTQRDVQELARVLTGVGVNLNPGMPNLRREQQAAYVRAGLFEFNPARHDFGDKLLLGQTIRGHGLAELDEALDRLARHPATARFIGRKLATYWVTDEPSAALVERAAQAFAGSDGDITQTLRAILTAPEFNQPGRRKFKDPMRYVISAVRLAYDDKVILNTAPILGWLNRMGEPLYGRATPDGYPLGESAWASPGQMAVRFEIARVIGSGSAGLFKSDGPQPRERAAFPQLANALYHQAIDRTLGSETRKVLEQAASPQEWNTFLLSAPELMVR